MRFLTALIKETYRGSTLYRALLNNLIRTHCSEIGGKVIDLGSGRNPYYHKWFDKNADVLSTDIGKVGDSGGVVLDLDKLPLPFEGNSFNNATFFNVLELVKNPEALMPEVYRIIRPGGKFYFSAILITYLRPEPKDYVRWTGIKIMETLTEAGFKNIKIIPIGERVSSATNLIISPIPLGGVLAMLFKLPFYLVSLLLDRMIPANIKNNHPSPTGYFCIAEK